MRSILYYNIRAHIRQKYHIGGLFIVVFLCIATYMFSTLSPADHVKIFREMFLAGIEFFLVILSMYYIVTTVQGLQKKTWPVLHTQGASYMNLFLSHWLSGITYIIYCVLIAMICGVVASLGYDTAILLLMVYMMIKVCFIYTFAYTISFFVRGSLTIASGLVVYLRLYTSVSIQTMLQNSTHNVMYMIIHALHTITPEFMSVGLNPIHIQRLSVNIFSIVLDYGIYTLLLLTIGVVLYPCIRRK